MLDRLLRGSRFAKIAALSGAAGDGERRRVTGTVCMLDDVLTSPCSGQFCVAFSVRIFEPSRREPGSFDYNVPFDCVELRPFAIECEFGTLNVDSHFADIDLPQLRISDDHLEPERWLAFCEDKHLSPRSHGAEALVKPGDRVTLAGIVQRRAVSPTVETGYRDASEMLWLVGDFDHPLIIGAPVE